MTAFFYARLDTVFLLSNFTRYIIIKIIIIIMGQVMIDIKKVNDDISKIAARNNVAVFVLGDLFNKNVKNHYKYGKGLNSDDMYDYRLF